VVQISLGHIVNLVGKVGTVVRELVGWVVVGWELDIG